MICCHIETCCTICGLVGVAHSTKIVHQNDNNFVLFLFLFYFLVFIKSVEMDVYLGCAIDVCYALQNRAAGLHGVHLGPDNI